jgi:hypothetical protein
MNNMNPKEKAEELLRIFYNQMGMPLDCEWNDDCYNKFKDRNGLAKTCALIAVDEILNEYKDNSTFTQPVSSRVFMYQRIREEIEKL